MCAHGELSRVLSNMSKVHCFFEFYENGPVSREHEDNPLYDFLSTIEFPQSAYAYPDSVGRFNNPVHGRLFPVAMQDSSFSLVRCINCRTDTS